MSVSAQIQENSKDLQRALKAETTERLVALSRELQAVQQEGIWKGIKKAAGTVADVADTAVSAIPVVGTAYNAGIGAYKAQKAVSSGAKALGQWATGKKKEAAKSWKQAKTAGVDAATRGAVAAADLAPVPGAGALAKVGIAAGKAGVKQLAKSGGEAAKAAINKPKPAAPSPLTTPLVKKKPLPGTASENVALTTGCELTEFLRLAGAPKTSGKKDAVK